VGTSRVDAILTPILDRFRTAAVEGVRVDTANEATWGPAGDREALCIDASVPARGKASN